MTASVAVCLTITSPFVFKIAKSFLVWLLVRLSWLASEWNNGYRSEPLPSSDVAENQTPLLQSYNGDYGTNQRPKPDTRSTTPDAQHLNGEPVSSVESQRGRRRDFAKSISKEQITAATLPDTGHHPDLERRSTSANEDQGPVDILERSSDSREFVWKFARSLLHGGAKQAKSPSTIMIVLATVLFGLFVVQATAGVFSAKIASNRAGLSSSRHCGIWQFNQDAGGDVADRDDINSYRKEARASRYARTCYNSPDPIAPFSCKIFYNQSIAYTTKTLQPCPFASSELCHEPYSAISFDTGYVDASVIGINAPVTHKFRRTTSCSPLNRSEPYIQPSSPDTDGTAYRYYYGAREDTNYTFNTSGQPFEWLVPVYSAK